MGPRAAVEKKSIPRLPQLVVCAILVALVWIVFGQTLKHDFVNYDDKTYVYGNSLVTDGVTWDGLLRAFVDTKTGNWHPLTTISHMVDCQFYGVKPGGHHLTNLILHAAAAVLLFLVLQQMTANAVGNLSPNAFVAALFAIHPVHVESVAWIAERKDVLSAFFFMLTLLAYARYAKRPSIGRYLVVAILFICGLLSKPMLVSVPVVLLLLDYWPLQRFNDSRSFGRLFLEKLPLALLAAVSGVITFLLQERAAGSLPQLPLFWRIQNAIVSYVIYVRQLFWPAKLAVFYPPPDRFEFISVAAAGVFLIAVTIFAIALRRTRPYLFVGWLWYLIMLLPVIGIVEVGLQGHADRYTYLPHIGLAILISWAAFDLLKTSNAKRGALNWRLGVERWALRVGCFGVVLALVMIARTQASYWRNSETLWQRALAVTRDNDVAHTNLGLFMAERGQLDDALNHFETALQIRSSNTHPHYALTLALIQSDIADVFVKKGQLDEAIPHLREAVELQPAYANAHFNLGNALIQKGEIDEAIAEWQKALSIQPNDSEINVNLAGAFAQKGEFGKAISLYDKALAIEPKSVFALNNLAWILATAPDDSIRNGARSVELAQNANEQASYPNPILMRTLAAAFAETGDFAKAIDTAQRASELSTNVGKQTLAERINKDIDLYRNRHPLREEAATHGQKIP